MITKITGEQPFQVLTNNFSISPSNEGYTLQISADGKNYSNLFTVGAGVTRLVTGVAANSYYRLSGNQSQVSINWMKTCVTEGGAAGNELIPQESLPENADPGTVVALTNGGVYQFDGTDWNAVGADDFSAYWTSAETKTYVDSADTIIYASAATYADDVIAEALTAYTPTSGFSTINGSAITDGSAIVIQGGGSTEEIELPIAAAINDVRDTFAARLDQQYYTKQEVNNIAARKTEAGQVDAQIKDYVDPVIAEVNETIEDKELPVSAALNDLNTNKVSGVGITKIQSITQADYDALTVKDPATLYIIKD